VVARIYDPRRAAVYQRLGIPTVATVRWTADQILRRMLPEGSEPEWRDASGLIRIEALEAPEAWIGTKVRSLEEVGTKVAFLTRLGEAMMAGPNLVLQEYIDGGPESIWMFDGYFNSDSDCLIGFTGQKIRQYPPYTGPTSLGVCVTNPLVDKAAREFLKRVGYQGIVDLGFRFDARDGSYRLLDVNPRIGATFRLFLAANGLDVARALYLDLTGAPRSATAGRPGRRWLVENSDVLATAAYMRDGVLAFGEWIRSFRQVEEGAWFAWDDPMPFVSMAVRLAGPLTRGATRLVRRHEKS